MVGLYRFFRTFHIKGIINYHSVFPDEGAEREDESSALVLPDQGEEGLLSIPDGEDE